MRARRAFVVLTFLVATCAWGASWRRALVFVVSSAQSAHATVEVIAAGGETLWSRHFILDVEASPFRTVIARGWALADRPSRATVELAFSDAGVTRCDLDLDSVEARDEVLTVHSDESSCALGAFRAPLVKNTGPVWNLGGDFWPDRPPWINVPPRPGYDEFLH